MSIPKSKMISPSKAILAMASVRKDCPRLTGTQQQNVNITLNTTQQPENAQVKPKTREIDEGVFVVEPTPQPIPQDPYTPPELPVEEGPVKYRGVNDAYLNLGEMRQIISNSEQMNYALILIIDLIQSNPLIVNKYIIPIEQTFTELVKILTNADYVEIQYNEDIGCVASKKYKLIDDVFVIKNEESKNLKYSYPEVFRLFDRFKISTKMIAIC